MQLYCDVCMLAMTHSADNVLSQDKSKLVVVRRTLFFCAVLVCIESFLGDQLQ